MNIIIVGAGKVGYTLAKYLSIDGDNIIVIDNKDVALEHINNNLDVMCIKGNCTSLKVLDEADINTVAVLPSFRRKGMADKLLSEIFLYCDEINAFHLEVRESNIPAISLYKKNGFETDGIRKNFYSNPTENAILMTKRKN